MTLEEFVAELNSLAFFKEFAFSKNTFSPRPGRELELADSVLWFGEFLAVFQLKERRLNEAGDAADERRWFQSKVIRKATKQIRDSLRYLQDNQAINITNDRGHAFDIVSGNIRRVLKLVVYLPSPYLPEDCLAVKHYVSQEAGFIHILPANDYLGILQYLRIPSDIISYFEHREEIITRLGDQCSEISEPMILGHFIAGAETNIPSRASLNNLRAFVQDEEDYDLSQLIGNLHDHIDMVGNPYDYYKIMLEIAKTPRSVWRELKTRFVRCVESVSKGEWSRPYRIAFPATGCSFMLLPVDPAVVARGDWTPEVRQRALQNLTHGAKYETRMPKGVGIAIAKQGEYFLIDWCLIECQWQPDPEMERMLAENNPFRPKSEKQIFSFKLADEN